MTCSIPISLYVTSDFLPRQCAEIDVRRHLEGRHRPDSAAHSTPPYRPLHPRQQAFGLIPTSAPGAQTGLKHFTPLHEAGAVGAIFVAYSLGPFMATCRSTATTWSGAKHTGQHWPLFRLISKGAKHWMSGQPARSPQPSPLSSPLSVPAPGLDCRMSSACASAGMSLVVRAPKSPATRAPTRATAASIRAKAIADLVGGEGRRLADHLSK